tara:strand:- start:177 stop:1646 length:1470 start_codon:yes stop_codon:yes gene_type:complete
MIDTKKNSQEYKLENVLELYKKGKYLEVIRELKLLEKEINNPQIYWYLSHTYFKLHNYTNSLINVKKFIKSNSKDSINLNFLGEIYLEINQIDKALKSFEEAHLLDKKNKSVILNLIKTNLNIGNINKSEKLLKNLLKEEPNNYGYLHTLTKIDKKYLKEISIDKLEKYDDNSNKFNQLYSQLLVAAKKEIKKDYRSEIKHLINAHEIYYNLKKIPTNQQFNYYLNLLPQFVEKFLNVKASVNKNIRPIFIMGLPRSGTTLTERLILSGNKSIQGLGETDVFDKVFFSKQIVKNHDDKHLSSNFNFNSDDINNLINDLVKQYEEQGLKQNNYLFTDKSIANFLYIDVINKIFPNSKFIYCHRNPLANIVGILKTFLPNVLWSHSLKKTFEVFNFYYQKLEEVQKNKNIEFFQINLEELSSNPQLVSKNLYKFLDVKWSQDVLKFNKKEFVTKTATNVQIRNDIFEHNFDYKSNYLKIFKDLGFKYDWLI